MINSIRKQLLRQARVPVENVRIKLKAWRNRPWFSFSVGPNVKYLNTIHIVFTHKKIYQSLLLPIYILFFYLRFGMIQF